MNRNNIDFRQLRSHHGSQHSAFEELTRQLILAAPPSGYSEIENRGAGADGGVEVLVRFPDGKVWGWQSKFFLDSFETSEVNQLKESFRSALKNYPALEKYIVAIPRNLSGHAEGKRNTQRKYWTDFKKWANGEGNKQNQTIELELWDESYFVGRLQSAIPQYAGMTAYWFDQDAFTCDWFDSQKRKAFQYIGNRYRPTDHVELNINHTIAILRKDTTFIERKNKLRQSIQEAISHSASLSLDTDNEISNTAKSTNLALCKILDSLNKDSPDVLRAPNTARALNELKRFWQEDNKLNQLRNAMFSKTVTTDPKTGREKTQYKHTDSVRYKIRTLLGHLGSTMDEFSFIDVHIFETPFLIVQGEAGSGKSHLLAEEVSRHINERKPAVFIPGHVIDNGDRPDADILRFLDLSDLRFENFLGTMNAAARASGAPALIVIDGINDSRDAAGWESGLPTLVEQLKNYSEISLCVSVRSAYKKRCVRDDIDLPLVIHNGFRGNLGIAAKEYLDHHGIERPSAPVLGLSEIFYNPLFLSTAVDAMKSLGLNSFPRDLDNIARLMPFWLKTVERTLNKKRYNRIEQDDGKIRRVLEDVASAMAAEATETLDYDRVSAICEAVVNLAPPAEAKDFLLSRLIDEGVFIDFPFYGGDRNAKVVTFGFQKFGDFFIADAILRECSTAEKLAEALKPGGKFGHILNKEQHAAFTGPRIALLALTPSRLGEELPYIEPNFLKKVGILIEDFIESISWRDGKSISAKTIEILRNLRLPKDTAASGIRDDQWYSLLIDLAPVPNCLANASFLKQQLADLSIAERDATWSKFLVGQNEVYDDDEWSTVHQIIDWVWNAPGQDIELQQVHPIAITLALLTSTMDRRLRDCATKGLSSLLQKYPKETPALISEFEDWDDPYVRERVLAASLAAVLSSADTDTIRQAAEATDRMVFAKTPVERHAWVRRYAQLIVEHAAMNDPSLNPELLPRARPPYVSQPIEHWPDQSEMEGFEEKARAIYFSVLGYGDFARYTMGGVSHHFSADRRQGDEPPLSRDKQIRQLVEQIQLHDEATLEVWVELQEWNRSLALTNLGKNLPWPDTEGEDVDTADDDIESKFAEAERKIISQLPETLARTYEELQPFSPASPGQFPKFDEKQAQYWIANRTLEIGWDKSIHEDIENEGMRHLSAGRNDHQVERIGKKYQHIALAELIGYLADYHWYIEYSDEALILTALEEFEHSDIDPTYLAGSHSRQAEGYEKPQIKIPALSFSPGTSDENIAWTKTLGNIPDPKPFLIQTGEDGFEWFIVSCLTRNPNYMENIRSSEPFRSGQMAIELILVRNSDIYLVKEISGHSIQGNSNDIFPNSWPSAAFYGQRTYRHIDSQNRFDLIYRVGDVDFARTTEDYSPNHSGYDESGVYGETAFSTPCSALVTACNLRPKSSWSRLFETETGEPAFVDNQVNESRACIVRGDLLQKFAEQHELKPVWRVWVEKDGGSGSPMSQISGAQMERHDYIGFYFKDKDGLHGELTPFRD